MTGLDGECVCGSDDGSGGEDCVIGVGEEVERHGRARQGVGFGAGAVVDGGSGLGKRDGTRLDGDCVCGSDDGSEGEDCDIDVGEEVGGRGRGGHGVERGTVVSAGSGADGDRESRTRLDGESACAVAMRRMAAIEAVETDMARCGRFGWFLRMDGASRIRRVRWDGRHRR